MESLPALARHRLMYSATAAAIGACALGSTFSNHLYGAPALVVLVSTALCMWSLLLVVVTQVTNAIVSRAITVGSASVTIALVNIAANDTHIGFVTTFSIGCACLLVAISSVERNQKFAFASLAGIMTAVTVSFIASETLTTAPLISVFSLSLIAIEFLLIRSIHIPAVKSLEEATERAEIFSTITKSSREFHSREPEEAIRNIVNVTKTLGYISVSVVSFDRRQKIFEDGVPIPNVMDIAVRASATRRVTITRDEHQGRNHRSREGDIVGVPIWINGRYSAALIVQTSSYAKVTQRDCEALELLADQAGRALENAGKAAMDRRVVERLTDESQRDKLTGLGNRRFADAMVASMKPGDVLAMIDLDGLKSTNDVYGHASGDQLLHEVGSFLAEQVRNPDSAARLGGDEFMILLHNADGNAEKILERIRLLWQDRKLFDTTFFIGMAVHHADRTTRETVEAADDALYEAKKAGKNRLVCSQAA